MAKLYGTEVIYRFASTAVGILGLAGQLEPGTPAASLEGRIERTYLSSVSYRSPAARAKFSGTSSLHGASNSPVINPQIVDEL